MSARTQTADRRRQPRQPRDGVPGCIIVSGGRREVTVRDISTTGAGFHTEAALTIGEVVLLRIGIGPARLPQRCKVMRCEPDGDTFDVGVEFVGPSPRFLAQERL